MGAQVIGTYSITHRVHLDLPHKPVVIAQRAWQDTPLDSSRQRMRLTDGTNETGRDCRIPARGAYPVSTSFCVHWPAVPLLLFVCIASGLQPRLHWVFALGFCCSLLLCCMHTLLGSCGHVCSLMSLGGWPLGLELQRLNSVMRDSKWMLPASVYGEQQLVGSRCSQFPAC